MSIRNCPLTSGSYIALRTNQSNVSFDNLRITGSPTSYNTLVYLHGDHPSTGSGQVWAALAQ